MEPESSWLLVGFVSAGPQREPLLLSIFTKRAESGKEFQGSWPPVSSWIRVIDGRLRNVVRVRFAKLPLLLFLCGLNSQELTGKPRPVSRGPSSGAPGGLVVGDLALALLGHKFHPRPGDLCVPQARPKKERKSLLWQHLGKAHALARGVLHVETQPVRVGASSSPRERRDPGAAAPAVALRPIPAFRRSSSLKVWPGLDALLSSRRRRIRTASCKSAWSWRSRSCSRPCARRRRCPRWRPSWRSAWPHSLRCALRGACRGAFAASSRPGRAAAGERGSSSCSFTAASGTRSWCHV